MQKQIVVDCPSGIISKEAARSIARDIIEYFRCPEHMKAFEEWKKTQRKICVQKYVANLQREIANTLQIQVGSRPVVGLNYREVAAVGTRSAGGVIYGLGPGCSCGTH